MSPKDKPTKPLDIYVRVSRVNGRDVGGDGGSASEQVKACRAKLAGDGYAEGQVFTDLDESGAKKSRAGFDEMLARIESGESGGVIVWNLSRFTRAADLLERVQWIESHGAAFVSVSEKLDTGSASGMLLIRVLDAINAMKVDEAREQFGRDIDRALDAGIYIGAAPTGYRKNGDRKLAKIEADCEQIAAAYKARAAGGSWATVARELDGVKGKRWTGQDARKLILSALYKGVLGTYSTGAPVVVPELAVVPPSVWEKAQPVKRDSDGPVVARAGTASLLTGILTCGGCGRKLTASTTKRNGKPYTYYQCKNGAGACDGRASIAATQIEPFLSDYLRVVVEAEAEAGHWGSGDDVDPEKLTALEVERDGAAAYLDELNEAVAAGERVPPSSLAAAQVALDSAQEAVDTAAGSQFVAVPPEVVLAQFEAGTVEEKRMELARVFSRVVVHRGAKVSKPVATFDADLKLVGVTGGAEGVEIEFATVRLG
jgi:site-specific DNA recombinase